MLSLCAILPHSPLLLSETPEATAFSQACLPILTETIQAKRIQHIITISSHPSFLRQGFSIIAQPKFVLRFPEFGDLVPRQQLGMSWPLLTTCREGGLPLEIIDTPTLDYGHAIPLSFLSNRFASPEFEILCLNDDPEASQEARQAFGRQLMNVLSQFDQPVAIVACGDLALAKNTDDQAAVYQANFQYAAAVREQFEHGRLDSLPVSPASALPPCLTGPLQMIGGAVASQNLAYRELACVNAGPTSLFGALLTMEQA